jgi:hypothetical protein
MSYRSINFYVCLPVCLSACLSVCLSVSLPVCLSACLPVCLSVCLSICLSACLSVCLSVCLLLCLCLSVSVCLCLSVSVCLCLSLSVSVCLSVSLLLYIYICVCVCVCEYVWSKKYILPMHKYYRICWLPQVLISLMIGTLRGWKGDLILRGDQIFFNLHHRFNNHFFPIPPSHKKPLWVFFNFLDHTGGHWIGILVIHDSVI